MAIDTQGLMFPKGERRATVKARARRNEASVIASVRAQLVTRDGYCRLAAADVGACRGPSEWAHLFNYKRAQTRGRPPEERHTTHGSAMLCKAHHESYDQHRLDIEAQTDAGADGPLVVHNRKNSTTRVEHLYRTSTGSQGDRQTASWTEVREPQVRRLTGANNMVEQVEAPSTTALSERSGIRLGEHFRVVPSGGLVVSGEPDFETCEALWESLLTMERTVQMAIGDAARYFRERFGESASQIISARTGWTLSTLRVYEWVADRVAPENRRLDVLSFSHHQAVASYEPAEQRRWLSEAAKSQDSDKPWSVARLKAAIAEGADPTPTHWMILVSFDSERKRDDTMRRLEGDGLLCKAIDKRTRKAQ